MKKGLLLSAALALVFFIQAQNIGIGTTTPNPSALLDVSSTSKGFLPPRMTYTQIKAISNPSAGLLVYDTEFKCIRMFDGTSWQCLQSSDKGLEEPPGDFAPWTNGSGSIFPFGIEADNSGNVYVTGYFKGSVNFGAINLSNAGLEDIFLVKYNANGDVEWAKGIGGTGSDEAPGLALDAAGNCYITALFKSASVTVGSIVLSNTNAGTGDILVAKIDPAGTVAWATANGGTGTDFPLDVDVDAVGNVYITGTYNSNTFTYGPSLILGDGVDDNIITAKYNSSGVVQWARSGGGAASERGQSIVVDAAGNSFITGFFQSTICAFGGLAIVVNSGGKDAFVACYNTAGDALWAKSASGGTLDEWSFSIALDASGNIYIAGYFASNTITFESTTLTNTGAAGTLDIFITKYNSSGSVLKTWKAGGTANDVCYGIAIDAAANFYITGYFTGTASFDGITLNNSGPSTSDVFVVKYDNLGLSRWAKGGGGLGSDYAFAIATNSAASRIYTACTYASKAKFGHTILTSGSYLLWVYGE